MKTNIIMPKVIKNENDYNAALKRAYDIFNAEPDSQEFGELEVLVILIKSYEEQQHPVLPPDPIEAIKAKMIEKGMKNKDLVGAIGSEGYVSSVLNGNRRLTLNMVKNLVKLLQIPADLLIGSI